MTQGVHTNQHNKYEYQGIKGLYAIADHLGINPCTLKGRIYAKGLTLEEAIAMGEARNTRPKKITKKSFADSGLKFIKRGNKKRVRTMPNFTELQKLAFGIASNEEPATA